MKLLTIHFLVLVSLFLFFTACERDATGIDQNRGHLNIYLTDAAAVYDSVKITFSEISANIDSHWVVVTGDPVTVDLLEWSNGKKLLIGSADVPAGYYSQVRLIIDDALIGVNSEVFPLDVPSGAQTGLKFGPAFVIEEGFTYDLVIDFDARRSIVTMGPPQNPKGYKLKPHIRVVTTAVSGSISGTVSNPEHLPIAYAIVGEDTVTSSLVEKEGGYFMLGFLPPAEYHITVLDTLGQIFEEENVAVMSGENYNLGAITLE